ncbi:hypothetical protein FRB95_009026 [Tulasnella sp. JGI-2019a]|nr:hypothetical protein FRB93_009292 [Tulasnella sp. JGI-2019a]KAG9026290.1 hypothetical protein FRB95_009026 [Tulasnella sp. JGI-2019a]
MAAIKLIFLAAPTPHLLATKPHNIRFRPFLDRAIKPTMTEPYLALSIPELLLAILGHLSANELMVAALVCKAWSAPAVDIRWRTKEITLSCLLAKLAPVEELDRYTSNTVVLAPKTPITQDHWSRFLERYANRVTILDVNVKPNTDSLALISTLLETFGGPFCSDLSSLTWSVYGTYETRDQPKPFDLLTMTKLQAFELKANMDESPLLSQLAHRAPQIQKIVVPYQTTSLNFSIFSHLRHLSYFGPLSTADYRNLACCSHLRVLRLRNPYMRNTSIQQGNGEAITFPHLEEFVIFTYDDVADETILRSVMPALRSLEYQREIYTKGTYTMHPLNGIIRTSPYLESITLEGNVPASQLEWVHHDGVQRLSFHNLCKLKFGPGAEDLELSTIARTFPKLKQLEVLWRRSRWHWSAIQMLGDLLPDLRHLGLSIDVSISSMSEAPEVISPIPSLANLEFKVLCIEPAAIDPFIRYLAILCPNIRNMSVENLLELMEVEGGKVTKIGGNARAFVKRFFDYKGRGRSRSEILT